MAVDGVRGIVTASAGVRGERPRHPILERLEAEHRAALPPARSLPAERLVIEEQDEPRFFFLCSGSVEVSYTSTEGNGMTPKIFSAPAVFGEVECITGNPMRESVRAVTDCELISIDAPAFTQLTERSPAFTRALLWDVARRFEVCILNERLLGFAQAHSRLLNFLLSSADAHGVRRGDSIVIEREHSQESLAAAVGLNRRSVTRALDFLKSEGFINKEGRYFVLHDLERLRRLAGEETAMLHHRSTDP